MARTLRCCWAHQHASPWAQAYYLRQRNKGASYHTAARSLAYKWLRVLYRRWKTRTSYDEAVYLEALRRHYSPLWIAVGLLSLQEAQV